MSVISFTRQPRPDGTIGIRSRNRTRSRRASVSVPVWLPPVSMTGHTPAADHQPPAPHPPQAIDKPVVVDKASAVGIAKSSETNTKISVPISTAAGLPIVSASRSPGQDSRASLIQAERPRIPALRAGLAAARPAEVAHTVPSIRSGQSSPRPVSVSVSKGKQDLASGSPVIPDRKFADIKPVPQGECSSATMSMRTVVPALLTIIQWTTLLS